MREEIILLSPGFVYKLFPISVYIMILLELLQIKIYFGLLCERKKKKKHILVWDDVLYCLLSPFSNIRGMLWLTWLFNINRQWCANEGWQMANVIVLSIFLSIK